MSSQPPAQDFPKFVRPALWGVHAHREGRSVALNPSYRCVHSTPVELPAQ